MSSGERDQLELERFLPYMMNRLAETISAELSTIYAKKFGVSTAEWRVVAHLAQHGTLQAQQIVFFTAMEKSMISRSVISLCKRGLVVRTRAEGDNRAKDLSLTESGLSLYRSIVPLALDWERELLEGLSSGEYRDLLYLLDKLKTRLDGKIAKASTEKVG